MNDNTGFLCIGHRGAMGYRPENTLPAFALAIEMGCPWVELDVHLCEGELVVIHDADLSRTTNGEGKIADVSLEYLRSLDAGDGAQVPTLAEVIETIDGRAKINIELKGEGTGPAVSRLLNDYCDRGRKPDDFLLSSFLLDELGSADFIFGRGALFGRRSHGDRIAKAVDLGAWSLNLGLDIVGQEEVREAHDAGLHVLVYTVNEPEEIRRMIDIGVDGVFTNYPDRVFECLAMT